MSYQPVYIVGGGPSLKGFDFSLLEGKDVIAINNAYKVLPNAQLVYFTDADYWQRHKQGLLAHKGALMRGALNPKMEEQHPRVRMWHLTGPHGLETKPGCLRHGSNSVYAALNLAAVHLNRKVIYLLGVDMAWGKPGDKTTTHWHAGYAAENGRTDPEAVYNKMKVAYNSIHKPLKDIGVEVYNANPNSGLEVFPKITIEQALEGYRIPNE